MTLGETIAFYRKKKGLTQEQFAEKAGTANCYISRIENGHDIPSVPKLQDIATALEAPAWVLLHGPMSDAAQKILVAVNDCNPSEQAELCANFIAMKENMRTFRGKI